MKIILVFFNAVSADRQQSVAYTSYHLAKRFMAAEILDKVICLRLDKNVDIQDRYFDVLDNNPLLRLLLKLLDILQRRVRWIHTRRAREAVFDWYASRKIVRCSGDLIFCARPLFLRTIEKAQTAGKLAYVQALTPHPLLNYAMTRNEEIRLGLESYGGYSNLDRAEKITRAINESDRLLTLSPDIASFTYNSYADMVERSKLLEMKSYFSIEQSEFSAGKDTAEENAGAKLSFLHVSFMNLIKGIPYLLAAWEKVVQKYSLNSKLILVGQVDASLKKVIRNRYGELPNMEFAGYVPDLAAAYRKADIFISPSIADAGPATILEAMSAGMPVIASHNCGFASLITEGKEGFTYDYNDVERLAEIMCWCLENSAELKKMGEYARARVRDFSIEKYADEIVSLLKGDV